MNTFEDKILGYAKLPLCHQRAIRQHDCQVLAKIIAGRNKLTWCVWFDAAGFNE